MDKLIYHPRPSGFEGLMGYMLRVAEGNRLTSINDLWYGNKSSLDLFMVRLGLQEKLPELERIFHQWDNVGNRPLWNQRTSRYCPDCLKEKLHWQQEWELSLMTVCLQHRCSLVEVCLVCKNTLTWHRSSLLVCSCGYELCRAEANPANDKAISLARALTDKLRGEDSKIHYLNPLDLRQLHELVITLGVYAQSGTGRAALRSLKIRTLLETQSLVNAAADVLLDWPRGFYQMLDRIQQSYGTDASARLTKRFGRFYGYLYSHFHGKEFGFLLHAFENYLQKNWRHALAGRNKRLSARLRNKHIWVSVRTIAKELEVGLLQIKALIENGEIESSQVTTTTGRMVLCVNRQQLDLIRGLLNDRVDLQTAAGILGISEYRVRQLATHHLVGKAIQPKEAGTSRWNLSHSNLEKLLRLGADLPSCGESDVGKVSLRYAFRYWLHYPYLFPRLMLAIIKQEILPIAVDPSLIGMNAWMFERLRLKHWVSDQIRGKRDGALTIPETAKALGIKQQVAYHLTGVGLIKIAVDRDSSYQLVELSALEEFKQNYILARDLCLKFSISPRHLATLLRDRGIMPVSGSWIDNGRQNVYQQSAQLQHALSSL